MNRLAEALQDKATAVAFGVAGLCIALLLSTSLRTGSLAKFPLNSSQYGSYPKRLMNYVYHAEEIYRQGYKECKNAVYRITTVDGDRLVLPSALLDELRLRPDHEINNTEAMYRSVEGKYTGLPRATPFLNNIIRADLTRNLPRLNARLSEEVDRSVKSEMPQCDDWTSVVITEKLLRIVAIVSGHIFLGPDLCRREEYIDASINFTVNVFKAIRALKRWPKIVRPIIQYFIPELKQLRAHREKSKQFLIPIIQERKVLMKEGKDLPDDLLQWMLNKSDEVNHYGDGEMAFMQLLLSMAAIHTTSMTTTNILYDIVAHPEVIPLLREEIQSVLKETDGVMNTTALFHMKLLDSVMRESQRVNPLSMVRFARYVEKPVTLKDGTTLPPGVVIEAPHVCITRDPELYPDPNTFDPYRFYHLRSGEREDPIGYKTTEQYQFVTVTKENMSFGLGRHACPGRFFAANEIKLILARMLLEFDFSMPEGQEKRFDNIIMAHTMVPDPKREILVRRVSH